MPAVSVIVPTFNEEKFLRNCLLSLKKQDFKDFEIIVVDNNSTDKTGEIAKKIWSDFGFREESRSGLCQKYRGSKK
jgi:cellulose synthase/poly-beta-1,6-N-acetylglucosamine synthase-like glycosyltransferase